MNMTMTKFMVIEFIGKSNCLNAMKSCKIHEYVGGDIGDKFWMSYYICK